MFKESRFTNGRPKLTWTSEDGDVFTAHPVPGPSILVLLEDGETYGYATHTLVPQGRQS